MNNYIIKQVDTINWDKIEKAYIESYTWGREYTPVSYGQIALIKNIGFAVRLTSYETNPKALYTGYNEPVYKDSCLEFFASFNNDSPLYMNFEANSNGAFLAAVRADRKNKTPIDRIVDTAEIKIKGVKNTDNWFVEYILPFGVIGKLFQKDSFISGDTFMGNIYKCGDETSIPHYGSLYPIDLPSPDFHCPKFFGKFEIE